MAFNGIVLLKHLMQCVKRNLTVIIIFLVATNTFSEEIINHDYTFVYRMNNDNDIQIVLDAIKRLIAENNHYNCTIKNAESGNENAEIFLIGKPLKNDVFNYTMCQCIFYSKGKRIDLILSNNEIFGLTKPYSSEERKQVFERFFELYRWNVLGILP